MTNVQEESPPPGWACARRAFFHDYGWPVSRETRQQHDAARRLVTRTLPSRPAFSWNLRSSCCVIASKHTAALGDPERCEVCMKISARAVNILSTGRDPIWPSSGLSHIWQGQNRARHRAGQYTCAARDPERCEVCGGAASPAMSCCLLYKACLTANMSALEWWWLHPAACNTSAPKLL